MNIYRQEAAASIDVGSDENGRARIIIQGPASRGINCKICCLTAAPIKIDDISVVIGL